MARKKIWTLLPMSIICLSTLFNIGQAQQGEDIALVVDMHAVTRSEFNRTLAQARAELRGSGLSDSAIIDQAVKNLALSKVLENIAFNSGIQISDLEVNNAIQDIASRNGATIAQLREYLQYEGIPYAQFKENIRKQMLTAEIRNQMMRSVRVTDDEVDIYMRSDEFKQLTNQLAKSKQPSVKVRHILINVDNATTDKEAKLRADQLYGRISAGEDFATLARAQSQDPVSAAQGGELGWIGEGQLVPEFEKVMLNLKPNEVSKPVKTPFGYHIIVVEDKKIGLPDESQMKNLARDYYYRKKAQQQYSVWQDRMLAEVYIERRF